MSFSHRSPRLNRPATRIYKKVRGLFWPWCVAMILAALPGTHGLGFFVGVPLVASFSFGNEFRHRTISLLISQPIGRMKIWDEKLSAMLIAVVPVLLICAWQAAYFWSHGASEIWKRVPDEAMSAIVEGVALWFIITVASAPYWTLRSRSMLGGLGLLLVQSVGFSLAFIFVQLASWKATGAIQWFGIHILAEYQWLLVVAAVFLCYAGVSVTQFCREDFADDATLLTVTQVRSAEAS
jgi:hypothetical protein